MRSNKINLFYLLSLVTTILVVILLPYGALVRLTGSGLACPDWPFCYGQLWPEIDIYIWYELSHRYLATLIGFLAILLVYFAYRQPLKKYFKYSLIILLLIILQGVIGGLTVIFKLHPVTVLVHLIIGNIILWMLVRLTLFAKNIAGPTRVYPVNSSLVILMNSFFFMVIFLGGLNSSTYAGFVCSYFPLCSDQTPGISWEMGQLIAHWPEEWNFFVVNDQQWMQLIHRLLAVCFWFISFISLILVKGVAKNLKLRRVLVVLFILINIQLLLGITNSLLGVPILVSLLHSVVSTLICACLSYAWHRSNI